MLDIRRRETAQREASLIDKCRQATEPITKDDDIHLQQEKDRQNLDQWNKELNTLNQEYWSIERLIYIQDTRCPSRPLKRAYTSFRKKPQWYLFHWLCEDCASRGGCCGRACGCCIQSRRVFRPNGHGHCTKFCDCCIRARGFELDEKQQDLCQPTFDLKTEPLNRYTLSLIYAYVFGV